ncbi:MAG: hypothetical protein GXX90_02380 [Microbacteriaceae bacterium]|nr:hypothetical protein [Microbacteriaceae bacterium]
MRSAFFDHLRPQLRWEGDARLPERTRRAAVVAQFSTAPRITPSLDRLVRELVEHDYDVLLSSACPIPEPLEWPDGVPDRVAVLRKPNIGYDFGSWAAGFLSCPQLFEAERVLQVNDSLLGPFWSLDEVLADFDATHGDWWGLVRSFQVKAHLQSYFLGFTSSVLRAPTFRDYWASVRPEATKQLVIDRYEFGLSTRLHNEAFVASAFLEAPAIVHPGVNPMIDGWEKALRAGVPFIKRELITRPHVVPQGDRVPGRLREAFGIDIDDWM